MAETGARVRHRARSTGTVSSSVELRDAGETVSRVENTETPNVDMGQYAGPVGYVRVEGSVTQNMGNFNSVRVSVAVEMPCQPTEDGVDRIYAWCSAKVDACIETELERAVGGTAPQEF